VTKPAATKVSATKLAKPRTATHVTRLTKPMTSVAHATRLAKPRAVGAHLTRLASKHVN
jgi:hypothetical protein